MGFPGPIPDRKTLHSGNTTQGWEDMVRPDSISSRWTASVLSRIRATRKKNQPRKSSAILAKSDGPNHTSSSGAKEAAGR